MRADKSLSLAISSSPCHCSAVMYLILVDSDPSVFIQSCFSLSRPRIVPCLLSSLLDLSLDFMIMAVSFFKSLMSALYVFPIFWFSKNETLSLSKFLAMSVCTLEKLGLSYSLNLSSAASWISCGIHLLNSSGKRPSATFDWIQMLI